MWFRIGINLGDVMVENDDLYGDGVNIAARLQGLAEPGGILISGTVFDQVKHKLSLGFDYLGAQSVKNIADEVPTYRVVLQAGAVLPPKPVGAAPAAGVDGRDPRWPRVYRSAAQAGVVIAFLFAINMLTDSSDFWFQWPTLGIFLCSAFAQSPSSAASRPAARRDAAEAADSACGHQYVARPPETSKTAPVVKEHSSLASQQMSAAISSTVPKRPIGIFDSMKSMCSSVIWSKMAVRTAAASRS